MNPCLLAPVLVFCTQLVTAPAHAQLANALPIANASEARSSLATTVALASQYVSRGIRQTWGRPALQLSVDYSDDNGWSAGTFVSNVSDRFIENGALEWNAYGGYSGSAGDIGYSATAIYYKYPGARIAASGTRFDYGEVAGALSWKGVSAKYFYTVTPHFFGIRDARGTGYLDLGSNHDVGHGYTLGLHAGNGRVAGASNEYWNWRDARVSLARTLAGGLTVTGAYSRAWGATDAYDAYSTGLPNRAGVTEYANAAKGTFVLTLATTF
ncbi:MAG: TorF family putative porin [Telluria sp.]